MLLNCSERRGIYYRGVTYRKGNGKFRARCRLGNGKRKDLGDFDTELQAHAAYLRKKAEVIRKAIEEYREELHSEIIDTLNTKANQCINLAYYL